MDNKTREVLFLIILISGIFQKIPSDLIVLSGFSLKYSDPSLFQKDILTNMFATLYPGFFPQMIIPLMALGDRLYLAFYVMTFLFKAFFILAVYFFSRELSKNNGVALISAAASIFTKTAIGSEYGFSYMIPRTVVFVVLIISLYLLLKKRYIFAFALLAVSAYIHPLSGFVFAGIFFLSLLATSRKRIKDYIMPAAVFIILSIPMLFYQMFYSPKITTASHDLLLIRTSYLFLNNSDLLVYAVWNLPFLLFFLVGSAYLLANKRNRMAPSNLENQRLVLNVGLFAILVFIVNYLLTDVLHSDAFASLQLYRVSNMIILFGTVYGAYIAYSLITNPSYARKLLGLALIGFLILYPFKDFVNFPQNTLLRTVSVSAEQKDWMDMMSWAYNNTDKEDLFITPPDKDDFRVFSRRGTVGEWLDGSIIMRSRDYSLLWWERMTDLGYTEKSEIARGYSKEAIWYPLQELWIKLDNIQPQPVAVYGFYQLKDADFLRVSEKYGAKYLITKAPQKLSFPVAYENDHYVAYELPESRPG